MRAQVIKGMPLLFVLLFKRTKYCVVNKPKNQSVKAPTHFEYRFRVNEKPENYIRHVNNLRYLEWFVDVAIKHADILGWGIPECKKMNLAWVAKSHTIEYISPAYQNDELLIRTWIEKVNATRITRCYECKRTTDEKIIAKASTVWVIVDYGSGKPKTFPKELKTKFEELSNS